MSDASLKPNLHALLCASKAFHTLDDHSLTTVIMIRSKEYEDGEREIYLATSCLMTDKKIQCGKELTQSLLSSMAALSAR